MAEEHLKSIIEVDYVGDGMQKYVADLVRVGAVSEDVGRQLNKALGGKQLLSDMAQLSTMLGNLQNHSVDFNALAGGLAGQLNGASTALRKSIADYESSVARGAQGEMRQTFAMVVALDQAIRRLPKLDDRVALRALSAGAVGGGTALPSNTSQVSINELLKVIRPIEDNTAAIRLLTASIRSNGFAADQPVRLGVTERGQYGVIDGSQRVLAARAAGYTELPATLEYAQRARPNFQRDTDLAALVRKLGPVLGSSRTLSPGMLSTGTPGEINSRQWFPNALTAGLQSGNYVRAGSRNNNILSDKAPDALFSAVAQLEEQALRGPIERIKRATYGSQGGKPRVRQTESLLDELNSAAHQIVSGTVLEAKNDVLRALPAGRSPRALGAGSGSSTISASFYQRELETAMLAAGSRGNFGEAERLGSIADYRPNARSGASRTPRDPSAQAARLVEEVGELEAALANVEDRLKRAAARAGNGQKAAKDLAYETNYATATDRLSRLANLPAGEADDLPARALTSGRLTRPDIERWMKSRAGGNGDIEERLGALFGWDRGNPLTELDWSSSTHNGAGRRTTSRQSAEQAIPGFITPQDAQAQLLSQFREGSRYEAEEQALRERLRQVESELSRARQATARQRVGVNELPSSGEIYPVGAGRSPLALNAAPSELEKATRRLAEARREAAAAEEQAKNASRLLYLTSGQLVNGDRQMRRLEDIDPNFSNLTSERAVNGLNSTAHGQRLIKGWAGGPASAPVGPEDLGRILDSVKAQTQAEIREAERIMVGVRALVDRDMALLTAARARLKAAEAEHLAARPVLGALGVRQPEPPAPPPYQRGPLALPAGTVVQGDVVSSRPDGKRDTAGDASRQAFLDRIAAEKRAEREEAERAAQEEANLRLEAARAQRDRAARAVQEARETLGAGAGGAGGGGTPPPRPPRGGGGSDNFDDDWRRLLAQMIGEVGPESARSLEAARRAVVAAKANLREVTARADLPVGTKFDKDDDTQYGFRSEDERTKAVSNAEKAVINAQIKAAKEFDLLAQGANTLRLSLAQQFEQHRVLEQSGAISPQQRVGYDIAAAKREEQLAKTAVNNLRGTSFADSAEGQQEYQAAIRRLTQATAAVTRAQAEQKSLIDADNAAQRAETASAKELAAAERVAAAEARKQAASASRVADARSRTFGQNFAQGFGGRPDADGQTRPYAEQLGQAAKFSVFYGAAYQILFAITGTLQATLNESIQFEQAMTDLTLASGRTGAQIDALGNELGSYATDAGFAPSQGVQTGARSLGLYGVTGSSAAEQDRVARISAEVVSKLAVGAKTEPAELQANIAAVTQALGVGVAGQYQVADLDAYLTKKFGVQQGSTLETLAQSGSVGIAAGFDPEQLFAIAAQLQSRTGQTSSTVAGYMAQIFSRGGEGSLVDVAKKTGVDSTQKLADIVADLAEVYKNADPQQQAEISSAFGRGKVQSAAISLLSDFPEIQRISQDAQGGAVGEADRQFSARMNNLGGQLAQMVGQLKAVAGALGQSGLLDPIGVLVVLITELARSASILLSVWNQLPNVIQDTIIGLAALGLLTKTKTGAGILGASAEFLGGRAAGKGAGVGLIGPTTEAGAFFASSGKTLLTSVARFAAPVGLAVGGLMAVASLVDTVRKMKAAEEQSDALLKNVGLGAGSSAGDYDAKASELDAQARRNRDATGVVAQVLTLGHANDSLVANADVLQAEATRLREVADSLRDQKPEATPDITGFDPESLSTSLALIASSGGTAETQFRALEDALTGSTDAARKAREAFKPDVLASQFADTTIDKIDQVPGSKDPFSVTKPGETTFAYGGRGSAPVPVQGPDETVLASELIPDDFRKTIADRAEAWMKRHGIDSFKDLDAKTAEDMARLVSAGEFEQIGEDNDLSKEAVDGLREQFVQGFKRQILAQTKDWRKLLRDNKKLTDEDLTTVLGNIGTLTQGRIADTPTSDLNGIVRIMRQQVRLANAATKNASGDQIPVAIRFANQARIQLAEAEINKLEQARRAAQQNATTAKQVRAIGGGFVRKEIATAVRLGAQDQLAAVISRAGDYAIDAARDAIDAALAVARAAVALQAKLAGFIGPISAQVAAAAGKGTKADIKGYEQMLASLNSAVSGGPEALADVGGDVPGVATPPPKEPEKSAEDRKAEREAARQEMLDLRNSLYLLSIDLSDPLAMATAAVKDARRRLASDIGSGQSKAQIAGDRVTLRQAEIDREATAFQQRLDRMQTNEELGRITHRKYMSYLEAEKNRLEAIKNRTYQQQQQLDTVERAMKEAASSMDAMWNFGDIKLPTPYQIRRELTEQTRQQQGSPLNTGSGWGALANDRSGATIYIDGADVGMVRKILSETLGKGNATVTNRPRRR